MQQTTLNRRIQLIFFLAIIAFYLYGLGAIPLVGPDEPRYAEVAREMFERGDFVTPTLGGYTWFEKPALLYWFQIISYHLFGVSEFSARLGSALSGLITAFTLFRLGNKIQNSKFKIQNSNESKGQRTKDKGQNQTTQHSALGTQHSIGFWTFIVFATSVGAITFSRAASFDIIVTMPVTVSLAFFFASEIEEIERKRWWYLAGFYAFIGVALLAKGLVGIVIPFGVVFWYFVIQRRFPEKKILLSLLWGVPLCLLVAAIWYAPVMMKNGWKFIDEFFIQHHFARYTSNKYQHPQPVYFFFLISPLLVLPWSPFLITALWNFKNFGWRKIESAEERFRLFSLIWLLLPILFFSLSGSKLPGYILPALPAASLLAGLEIERYICNQNGAKAMRLTGILLLVLSIGGAIYILQKTDVSKLCVMLVFIPLAIAGAFTFAGERKKNIYALSIAVATLFSFVVSLNCIGQKFAVRESVRDLIAAAQERGFTNNPVLSLHTVNHSAEFYAAGRLWRDGEGKQKRFESVAEVAEVSRNGRQPVLVLVPLEYVNQLTESKAINAQIIADNGELAIVDVRAR